MNSTKFEHLAFSAVAMLLLCAAALVTIGLDSGILLGAAIAPAAFFLGREHSQHEFKLIAQRGLGSVNDLHPLEGFKIWNWSRDAQLDLLFPVLGNALLFLAGAMLI